MPLRRHPEPVSPRALARVRAGAERPRAGPDELAARSAADGPGPDEGRGRHRPIELARGPVLELPTSLRGARWAPTRSAGLAVLAVVVLVAAVFGVRVWLAGSGGEPVTGGDRGTAAPSGVSRGTATLSRAAPGVSATGGAPSAAASPTAGATAAPVPTGPAGVVVVHVVGQVASAGVYRLSPGARIADAVRAAGGATRGADLSAVNLARLVLDGEQVHVPRPGEPARPGASVGGPGAGAGSAGGATGVGGGGAGAGGLVALNSADLSALDTLPGVGPVLAQRILDWRTEHGRFTSVEELGEVSGIGDKLLSQLTPKVTL
ncbi:helix-hairpin-helix domain-containing protein [Knoellia sp. CPCC 206435]|uniref:helix-hairpin-helix domain-containing protein n=1 Tax=Knoellia terrae TaxID=3404797 RepID=UPI003B43A572